MKEMKNVLFRIEWWFRSTFKIWPVKRLVGRSWPDEKIVFVRVQYADGDAKNFDGWYWNMFRDTIGKMIDDGRAKIVNVKLKT